MNNQKTLRWWAGVVLVPAVAVILITCLPILLRDRLPDPMAIHWGIEGEANGSMAFWGSVAMIGGMAVLAWVALVSISRKRLPVSMASATVHYLLFLLAAVQVSGVMANLDVADWRSAPGPSGLEIVGVIAIGVVGAVLGWYLGDRFLGYSTVSKESPSVGLSANETAVWVSSARSLWGIIPAVLLLIGAPFAPGWNAVGLILIGLIVSQVSLISGEVSEAGFRGWFGWVGWPRRRIPLEEIERAEVVDVNPMAYGGYGFRARPGETAWIVRKGPGLRVVRKEGRDLVATLPDPEEGAGLLNDLLRTQRR